MKFVSKIYQRMMQWARHPHAVWYLGVLSFAESSFFPIPPDVMLVPMALARPKNAFALATLTTLASVAGGVFAYVLGYFFMQFIHPYIIYWGYEGLYQHIVLWFRDWGFWVIFLAGFTPIPYKLFTLAAGSLAMPLIPFIIASFIGRGGRFYLVACLMRWGGERMEQMLMHYIDRIALGFAALLCLIGTVWWILA